MSSRFLTRPGGGRKRGLAEGWLETGVEHRNVVLGDLVVARDERHLLELRLRNEQPVERVVVVLRQLCRGDGGLDLRVRSFTFHRRGVRAHGSAG
jgi:hypothetical protein